ncbi:uncharacterized protein [Nicotiana tomentosiformis]|uniref:uncharacterized protein n=1 Tax=Nicotiana tomentosiformis TaxID=4098 RepID=UPI00388C5A24
MINEAQTLKGNLGEGAQGAADSFHNFFNGLNSIASEDVIGLGDLPVPKKILSPGVGGSSSSPKLVNQFPAPSVDPTQRRAIYMSIPEDARILSTPVGIASYLRCLVTEEDQARMNEVEVPCLFNEAQHALNRASVLHHEVFLRYREEFKRHEVVTLEFAEKKDTYMLLSEKLQAKLKAVRKEHADLVEQVRRIFELSDDDSDTLANDPNPQVQKRLDQIEQLQVEVDTVKAETEKRKKNMDRLTSEKETARAQLASAEEHEVAKSEVVMAKTKADKNVAQFKADVEAIQEQARNMVKHARWQSRREAIEGVHAQSFDILAKIENAKECEAKAWKLAYPEEDSEGSEESGGSDGAEDPVGDDVAPDKN